MTDHDDPAIDPAKERDQIIDAINSLGFGVVMDPCSTPEKAQEQIPLLAGTLAGILDLKELGAIAPDDTDSIHQWMSGYHYGTTGVQGTTTPEAAHHCLGVLASRLSLTWAVAELLGRHHVYSTVSAALIRPAAVFAAAASQGLETADGNFDPDPLHNYHRHARTALEAATAALDAAEAHLRSTDYDIDTRN